MDNTKETINHCKGCYTYEALGRINCRYIVDDNDNCPCSICIIKVVCNDACDVFEEYAGIRIPELIKSITVG